MARKMGLQYTLSYMHIGKRQGRSRRGFLLCGMMAAFACALCLSARAGERERLLGPFREKLHRVVFTKHFDMGGSHYAYTDAVSDEDVLNPGGVKKEFNFKPGSSLCMLSMDEGLNVWETTLIHDDNGVIRDPDVSYDGTRILFAWKKSARDDDYHLYEMDVATRAVRQLTFGKGVADYEGIYLPDGNIMFSSTRCFQNVDCWHVSACNMFLMDGDGKFMRRIGFDQVHSNYPQVHPGSGAVTYTRWEYNDRGQIYPQPLFQMHPNGAHQQEFYGNTSYFPTSILHARGIPGTQKVLAILSGHHTPQKGKLAIIDPSFGREETVGVTLVAPEVKPKGLIRIDQYGQKGDQWQYPYPLDENNYLVTFRPNGAKHFGIYFMNRKGERVLLAQDPVVSCNQPIPLAPRPKPPQVGYPIDWSKTNGTFTVKDVYAGPGLKGVARGTVKKLRVVALDFMATDIGRKHGPSAISDLAAWDVKVVLGETPVHEDGSAAFEVPARTPVWDEKARKLWNKSYNSLVSTDRAKCPANDTSQVTGTIDEHSRYVNWIGRWSVPTPIPPYSHGSSRSPLVKMLAKGHRGVKMTQEEMDKIACWIDLAVPHSGTWTEGMMADDEAVYLRVRKLRDVWRREETANIASYIKHLPSLNEANGKGRDK